MIAIDSLATKNLEQLREELGPLTPFEWTMTEKVGGSPMEFVLVLRCSGQVDVERFNQAILHEVKHQPLLQANATVGATHLASHWRTASNLIPKIEWLEESYAEERGFPKEFTAIDLESEIGFRFYGWQFNETDNPSIVMKFVFHHACCDGKGATEFIEQVLLRYESIVNHRELTTSDFEEEQIHHRNSGPAEKLSWLNDAKRKFLVRPRRVANLLWSRPRRFNDLPADQNSLYSVPPRQCSVILEPDTAVLIGKWAKENNATSNLVLAQQLFHTLNAHLNEEGSVAASNGIENDGGGQKQRRRQRLRILIPFSLRDDRHNKMPAANCVSMAYLEAEERYLDSDSPENPILLRELAKQLKFIRRWQLEYSWIESIESFAKLWPVIKLFRRSSNKNAQTKQPIATTVMSNLGSVFYNEQLIGENRKIKAGELEVESIHLSIPSNPSFSTNFSINFYRGRLTLDVTYLPSLVSRPTAQGLLDQWAQRIESIAQS